MYITCQECDTIYRLDEKLLKPGGSKVRCSQCGHIFVARPLEPAPASDPLPLQSDSTDTVAQTEERFGEEELTGIDMAELDSILEQDAVQTDSNGLEFESADLEWNEPDAELSLSDETGQDLDSSLQEDVPAENALTPEVNEIDLEMDFELHDEESADVPSAESGPGEISNEDLKDESEDDLDLVFDDDTLLAEADKIAAGEDTGGNGLAFDELDLEIEEPQTTESAPADSAADDMDTLDDLALDELELDLDLEEPQTAEAAPADTTDDDLIGVDDLAMDDLALEPEEPQKSEAAPADSGGDDLDSLDDLALDDLGLDFEESPTAEAVPAETTTEDVDNLNDLSLDDLDVDNSDALSQEPAKASATEENTSKLKDDLDLEFDLDIDDLDKIEPHSGEEPELSLDDGFEASLSETDQQNSLEEESLEDLLEPAIAEDMLQNEVPTDPLEEDIDLSDLEILSDQDSEEPEPVGNSQSEDLAIESKELENALDDSSGDELEDLEFTLDAEYEDKSAAFEPADEPNEGEEEDLDLSDIEQMLEADGSGSAKLEDLTATTGLDADGRWLDTPADSLEIGAADEFDLSEIEEAIEDAEKTAEKDRSDDELDLDFSIENEPSADSGVEFKLELDDTDKTSRSDNSELNLSFEDEIAPSADNQELELELELEDDSPQAGRADNEEFELSDLDDLIDKKPATVKADTIDTGDIELEFQIEEEGEDDAVPSKTRTAGIEPTTTLSGDTFEAALALKKPPKAKLAKQKKGTSKGLVFLFILILLGGGGYFGWDYMQKNGIGIPYVGKYIDEYLHPKPKDPMGILSLSSQDINSKFIENETGGRLFVITGKVLNQYPTARGMIRLQGNLYTKGKILAKTEKSFAGFQVSDQELANMPVAQIKARLSTPPKPQDKVTQVAAGQTLPFMVVFSDLPENLDEFAIEMVSSTPIE